MRREARLGQHSRHRPHGQGPDGRGPGAAQRPRRARAPEGRVHERRAARRGAPPRRRLPRPAQRNTVARGPGASSRKDRATPGEEADPVTDSSADSQLRHELRTPLNHIIGYAEMLLEDAGGSADDDPAAGLRGILDDARLLLRRINERLAPGGRDAATVDLAAAAAELTDPLQRIRVTCDTLAGAARAPRALPGRGRPRKDRRGGRAARRADRRAGRAARRGSDRRAGEAGRRARRHPRGGRRRGQPRRARAPPLARGVRGAHRPRRRGGAGAAPRRQRPRRWTWPSST